MTISTADLLFYFDAEVALLFSADTTTLSGFNHVLHKLRPWTSFNDASVRFTVFYDALFRLVVAIIPPFWKAAQY